VSPVEIRAADLRHSWERSVYAASVLVNVLLGVASVVILLLGAEWLQAYPRLAGHIEQIRLLAVAAVVALPAASLLRGMRRTAALGNAVRLSDTQLPELQAILRRHCQRLGMAAVPQLYLSGELDRCRVFSAGGREHIVLGGPLLQVPDPHVRRDGLAFALGAALGSIRLGHTRWWDDALLAYVGRIPVVRVPLEAVRTLSRDRYGAFLAPEGLAGLVVEASGGDMLSELSLDAYVRQATEFEAGSAWAWAAGLWRSRPHVAGRLRQLLEAGLFAVPARPSGNREPAC
jgi:hypothetical protein